MAKKINNTLQNINQIDMKKENTFECLNGFILYNNNYNQKTKSNHNARFWNNKQYLLIYFLIMNIFELYHSADFKILIHTISLNKDNSYKLINSQHISRITVSEIKYDQIFLHTVI